MISVHCVPVRPWFGSGSCSLSSGEVIACFLSPDDVQGRRPLAKRSQNLRAIHMGGSQTNVRWSGAEANREAVAEPSCDTQGREPVGRGTFVRCSGADANRETVSIFVHRILVLASLFAFCIFARCNAQRA